MVFCKKMFDVEWNGMNVQCYGLALVWLMKMCLWNKFANEAVCKWNDFLIVWFGSFGLEIAK